MKIICVGCKCFRNNPRNWITFSCMWIINWLLWWFKSETFRRSSVFEVDFEFCLDMISKSFYEEVNCLVSVFYSVCNVINSNDCLLS